MPSARSLLTFAAAVSSASGAYQGFNYGSTFTDGRPKAQSDFEAEFKNAAGLDGTNGAFTSARLYTMVQGGTSNEPISAIPAAINTKTSLLFGLWASAGQDAFNNELSALQKTIDQYCGGLKGLVAGISVGSEDLYRITPTGIQNGENPGAGPDVLAKYIGEVRDVIKGSCLSSVPIGHVDTWTAYVNGSNQPLIDAVDWLGMDTYPYFEDTNTNPIDQGKNLFQKAFDATKGAAGGKPVWVTETGWPVSGKTFGEAVPSLENARTYWKEVGCPLFGATNVWWYTMQDAAPTTPNPSFGIIGSQLTEKPLYDLSCDGTSDSTSPSSSSAAPTSSAAAATSSSAPSTTGGGNNNDTPSSASESVTIPASTSSVVVVTSTSTSVAAPSTSASTLITSTVVVSASTKTEISSPASTFTILPPSNSTTPVGTPTHSQTGGASASQTVVPPNSANCLNSVGAAVVAVLMAAAIL